MPGSGRTVVNESPAVPVGDRVRHWMMLPANTGGPACMGTVLNGDRKSN